MFQKILDKVDADIALSAEDAIELLSIENFSQEYYALLQKANEISHRDYGNKGYIFTQIGLDSTPCSGNCAFCSLAQCNTTFSESIKKSIDEILSEVMKIDFSRVAAVFLMTTADFDQEEFLKFGTQVRKIIPSDVALVANTGDFNLEYAFRLKNAGFTGAYHIVRLREGIDTALPPKQRIQTLDAIAEAGLCLYYCLEPIAPEHTYEEMVVEMLRAREYHVDVMAAMRRVSVLGTKYADSAMVNDFEMAKIVAVTRLVTMPKISMNVHEPINTAMLAGVNQLYAEIGVNPRDSNMQTEHSRGLSTDQAAAILTSAGYTPYVEK